MKEYQVVAVVEKLARRNGEICFQGPEGMDTEEIIEIMLNRYAKDGWSVKELFYVNNYSYVHNYSYLNGCKVLIVFERGSLDREGKSVRKRKFVGNQRNIKR